jgi:DNA ligase-1
MKFRGLASYLEKLEKTASRNEITQILADLFKETDSSEIDKVVYLVLGQLAPGYAGIVLNLAEKMMFRVLAKTYQVELDKVKKLYKEKGVKLMAGLLASLDHLSARFVARIPVGKLRLGFSDKTIIDALSFLVAGDKSQSGKIEQAYQVLPDCGLLAKNIKKLGLKKAVKNVSPKVGVPVMPMLAQRLKSPSEMIKKMGEVAVEPKLDGLRLSIHFKRGHTSPSLPCRQAGLRGVNSCGFAKAFTRNLNETSWMFPELKSIGDQIKGDEVILDSEAVGLDEKTKLMANFQTTMTRRRKHEIGETSAKVGITFYVFDLLFKDGEKLMDKSYLERRKALEATFKKGKVLKLVDYEVTTDPERINTIYKQKIKDGLEGVIVKKVGGTYVPGRTGWRWVKMKQMEASEGKLSDTIDCVVMGYTVGKGKRAAFGLGQFLVGVASGETFKTVTKIGTGLTDEQFREMKTRLKKLEVKEKPKEYEVHKNYTPDFWVTPSLVVEIAADEITKSPTHTAGLALRFPRLIKFRDDKSPKEATTLAELEKLFKLQKSS